MRSFLGIFDSKRRHAQGLRLSEADACSARPADLMKYVDIETEGEENECFDLLEQMSQFLADNEATLDSLVRTSRNRAPLALLDLVVTSS